MLTRRQRVSGSPGGWMPTTCRSKNNNVGDSSLLQRIDLVLAQLFGRPEVIAEAVEIQAHGAALVDLNEGPCIVAIVRVGQNGLRAARASSGELVVKRGSARSHDDLVRSSLVGLGRIGELLHIRNVLVS